MKMHVGEMDGPEKMKETMEVDITDEEAKGFKVGQSITMTVKGTIGMVALPYPNNPDSKSSLGIEVKSKKVKVSGKDEADISELTSSDDGDE